MSICVTCGVYFRQSPYNNSAECDTCFSSFTDNMEKRILHSETDYEIQQDSDVRKVINPSGKTQAVFYDRDTNEDM